MRLERHPRIHIGQGQSAVDNRQRSYGRMIAQARGGLRWAIAVFPAHPGDDDTGPRSAACGRRRIRTESHAGARLMVSSAPMATKPHRRR